MDKSKTAIICESGETLNARAHRMAFALHKASRHSLRLQAPGRGCFYLRTP